MQNYQIDGKPATKEEYDALMAETQPDAQRFFDQYTGFDYQGTMCSVTAEDQHGLTGVMVAMDAGLTTSVNFVFANKNKITLTTENIVAFATAWTAFRQTFFEV